MSSASNRAAEPVSAADETRLPAHPNRSADTGDGSSPDREADPVSVSRTRLVWDVVLFQFKLAADGLRDVLLSPVSIIAAIIGLVGGGDQPDRYFRRLLLFGRRTEYWINLFGHRTRGGTSDDLVEPLQARLLDEMHRKPWLNTVNSHLDDVNERVRAARDEVVQERKRRQMTEPPPGPPEA